MFTLQCSSRRPFANQRCASQFGIAGRHAPFGASFYVDMDLGVTWDGTKALVARTKFSDGKGYPDYSRLELFNVNATNRSLTADTASEAILKNINLETCKVYAPTMSSDQADLYYSVMSLGADGTLMRMCGVFQMRSASAFAPSQKLHGHKSATRNMRKMFTQTTPALPAPSCQQTKKSACRICTS